MGGWRASRVKGGSVSGNTFNVSVAQHQFLPPASLDLFVMELSIGDKVFYTKSTGLSVPANLIALLGDGHVELECHEFEFGGHHGTYKRRICVIVPFIGSNNCTMVCMGGIGRALSKCLLTCGIGVWLGTSRVAALISCTSPSVFCCISRNCASGGRSVTHLMDHGTMSRLMFGLIKATWPPRKMRERMRQMCVCLVLSKAKVLLLIVRFCTFTPAFLVFSLSFRLCIACFSIASVDYDVIVKILHYD